MSKIIVAFCATILLLASCTKEEGTVIEITEASYRVQSINDANCTGINGGSTIQVNLNIKIHSVVVEKLVSQFNAQNGQGGKDDYTLDPSQIMDGNLSYNWCYRFDDDDWFEEKFKLVGMTNMGEPIESKQVTLRIDRPIGAN